MWSKPDIPELSIQYYVGSSGDQFLVECYDEKNLLVRKLTCAGDAGFHTLDWDVRIYDNKELPKGKKKRAAPVAEDLVYAPPGNYKFKFTRGTDFSEITVAVEE
jgi:flagellar hook assembly protein FlgD